MVKAPAPARKTPGYDPEKRADDLKRRFARVSNRALGRNSGVRLFKSVPGRSSAPVKAPSFWMTALVVAVIGLVAAQMVLT
ncbi:hypothetical protein [Roseibium suaedae]|uniref:Uncharacterized protein n=1 Tax=Roseibium suaedae TaxID=735517 RepID=A0A1M7GLE4_9HYPH|nr:hypothetical protein [Roseibium suaedae]SHM17214.1 hypothetical protein SAMN05444272_1962 [Roseibium suaedae]